MPATRREFLIGAVGAVALGVTGCGGVGGSSSKSSSSSGASGTLTTQGFGKPDEVGQARINAFRAAYPKVVLKINQGDFDPQQFLSAVASGNPPDLVYMDRGLVGSYAAKKAIQPLDDLLSKANVDTGQYRPAAMKEVTLGGTVYGIPEFYNTRNILVNGKALSEVGVSLSDVSTTDWNALHSLAKRLYKPSGKGITRIGFDPKLPEFLPLWTKANGAMLVNDDGSPNLDDPKIVEALGYAVSLINEQGGWSKFKAFRDTWDLFGSGNEFVKDQAGAFPWEGWYVNVLAEASPSLDVQCVPFTDRQGKPMSFEDGSAWCLPKGAANATTAANWMKTMTELPTWLKAAAARQATAQKNKTLFTGLWTSNVNADKQIEAKYAKPGNSGYPKAVRDYYASTEYAFGIPGSRAGAEIKAAWQDAVNRVLSGQQAAKAAMARAQSDAAKAFRSAQ
jgi:multiple sugar transport system substrate-binding protein